MKKLIYLLAISFLFITLFCVRQIKAQPRPLSIGIAPTFERLQLDPGERYDGEFTVWNLESSATKYYINISSFRQIQNQPGSAIYLSPEEDAKNLYSASSWITINETEIDLVPNRNMTIPYSITVPLDATLGDYNVQIYFTSEEANKQDFTATYSVLSAGLPILVTIGDEYTEAAEILDFYSTKKIYERPNHTTLITRVMNLGDTHITPKGDIVLTNIFNQEVGRIPFNQNNQSTLRDNSGIYESNWELEEYINDGHLAIGPIRAETVILYRRNNPGFSVLSASTTFWIVPWKLIILILIVIIVLYVFITINKKKKRNTSRSSYHTPR